MIIIKRGLHKIPEERVPGDQFISPLIYWIFCFPFSLYHSNVSNRQVDKVGIWRRIHNLNWNCDCIFATGRTITKVDLPFNFTIFHCRMSINQPPWPIGTTSVCWHTSCWHFCTSSPHKTIPSLRMQLWTVRCYVTYLSISIAQVFIMIAVIGCKVK